MSFRLLLLFIVSIVVVVPSFAQEDMVVPQGHKGYLIGPGDEVSVTVLNEPQYNFITTVNEDGKIEVPVTNEPMAAQCKTERQLRTDIQAALGRYLKTPQINMRIVSRSRPPTTVYGEVRVPKEVTLFRDATLVELLAQTGGVTEDAGGMIQIFRTRLPLCGSTEETRWKSDGTEAGGVPFRLYSLSSVLQGNEESNPQVFPGDVILVQKASPVYIMGEVVSPQGIYLKENGLTLMEAIAKVSGVSRSAKTKDIKIYRLKSNSKDREIIAANYDSIRKGKQKDLLLQPYDIVEVDKAKDSVLKQIAAFALGTGKSFVSSGVTTGGARILY